MWRCRKRSGHRILSAVVLSLQHAQQIAEGTVYYVHIHLWVDFHVEWRTFKRSIFTSNVWRDSYGTSPVLYFSCIVLICGSTTTVRSTLDYNKTTSAAEKRDSTTKPNTTPSSNSVNAPPVRLTSTITAKPKVRTTTTRPPKTSTTANYSFNIEVLNEGIDRKGEKK